MPATVSTVTDHYDAAMSGPPGSREAVGWAKLVELGTEAATSGNRDIAWHSLALGEFHGAVTMFALFNGLPRADVKTFVTALVRQDLADAEAAR